MLHIDTFPDVRVKMQPADIGFQKFIRSAQAQTQSAKSHAQCQHGNTYFQNTIKYKYYIK